MPEAAADEIRRHARAIRAIADAAGIEPAEVPAFLARLWEGWENHPAYPGWCDPGEIGFAPRVDIYNPIAVAVFEHELGRSYIISDLQDLIASLEWGRRNLGEFAGIEPIPPDFPVSRWYTLVWGQSPRGRGNAYLSRRALKKYLPPHLHRWVNKARWYNTRPKSVLLEPGEQTSKTKKELFIERLLTPEVREEIARYIDPNDFWRAATGRVPAEEVPDLFKVRQLEMW